MPSPHKTRTPGLSPRTHNWTKLKKPEPAHVITRKRHSSPSPAPNVPYRRSNPIRANRCPACGQPGQRDHRPHPSHSRRREPAAMLMATGHVPCQPRRHLSAGSRTWTVLKSFASTPQNIRGWGLLSLRKLLWTNILIFPLLTDLQPLPVLPVWEGGGLGRNQSPWPTVTSQVKTKSRQDCSGLNPTTTATTTSAALRQKKMSLAKKKCH